MWEISVSYGQPEEPLLAMSLVHGCALPRNEKAHAKVKP